MFHEAAESGVAESATLLAADDPRGFAPRVPERVQSERVDEPRPVPPHVAGDQHSSAAGVGQGDALGSSRRDLDDAARNEIVVEGSVHHVDAWKGVPGRLVLVGAQHDDVDASRLQKGAFWRS